MNCEYCDNPIPANEKNCPSCGAAVRVQPPPAYAPQQQAASQQPQQVVVTQQVVYQTPPKSRAAYVILAIFLGGLGIHNFYAGYSGKGVVQLLISVCTCGYGGILVWIWAIIEACTVTVDARKVPMS